MAVNHYFQSGNSISNTNEQRLVESMVAEVIKQVGIDVYYIPRQIENLDQILMEDSSSFFDHYEIIEMFLENVDGFGGDNSELLGKFGIELRQTITLTVSRKRWEECVRNDKGLQLPNRPSEGDLIFLKFPTRSVLEIRKVDSHNPFYQLGKLYVYKLNCELYQYSHEVFNTGDAEVDIINDRNTDELQNLVLDEYGYGLLAENGNLILQDDFVLKNIEPISDNEELMKRAEKIVDYTNRNPFAELGFN